MGGGELNGDHGHDHGRSYVAMVKSRIPCSGALWRFCGVLVVQGYQALHRQC